MNRWRPSFSTSSVLQYHENVVEGWDEGWWHVHVVVLLVCYMPGTILWYGCLTSCFMHACYGYYCWIKTSQHDIVLHIALTVGPRRFRFPSYSESGRGDTLISPFGLWWCQYEWSIWCQYDQYEWSIWSIWYKTRIILAPRVSGVHCLYAAVLLAV